MYDEERKAYYTRSVREFTTLTNVIEDIETGVSVIGEVKLGRGVSVLIDKEVTLPSPITSKRTYQRVLEVRNLTPEEETKLSHVKLYLREIYNGIFKHKLVNVLFTVTMTIVAALNLESGNFLTVFTSLASILLVLGPKRLIYEIAKLVTLNKRRENSINYLRKKNLLSLCELTDDIGDIKLFIRKK